MKRGEFVTLISKAGLAVPIMGCEIDELLEPLGPDEKIYIEPKDIPEIYPQWWAEMEKCAGRRKDFSKVKWYKYPGDFLPCKDSKERCDYLARNNLYIFGEYNQWRNEIYMAEGSLLIRKHVGHEMLHALGLEHGDAAYERCGADSGILARLGIDLNLDVDSYRN